MGRIAAPYGIQGWVRVKTYSESPDALLDHPRWWLREAQGWREHGVAAAEWRDKGLLARFEACGDRSAAESLKGLDIGIPRSALPGPEPGEHYWADLIGLAVKNREGVNFGQVSDLIATGANDVLVVSGERERLIPYLEGVIVAVDIAARTITVDWDASY